MTRSELMSRIRSKGNASTELALARVFRRRKIKGWRRHVKVAGIDVDFVFPALKIAVFTDGCFWHGCDEHANLSRLSGYWLRKILGNLARDKRQKLALRAKGWAVVRFWEHDLKKGVL